MRNYCKAYKLRELRQFSGWVEQSSEQEAGLADDDIVYLWDDYSVARTPVQERGTLFEAVTPEWQAFCRSTLAFTLPAQEEQPLSA